MKEGEEVGYIINIDNYTISIATPIRRQSIPYTPVLGNRAKYNCERVDNPCSLLVNP